MRLDKFRFRQVVLACMAALTLSSSVAADWGDDVAVSIAPLVIDLAAEGANFAELQLLFDDPDTAARDGTPKTPFKLIVVATDEQDQRQRALALYELTGQDWQRPFTTPLADSINMLQWVETPSVTPSHSTMLLVYADNMISALDAEVGAFNPVRSLNSIYRAKAIELDADVEFARELTGDTLDDLLVPDFEGWRFSAANADGTFAEPQLFGPKPLMNMGSARYINFTAHTPYVFDHNQDGRLDVAFWEDDALLVYLQQDGAVFATTPVRLDVTPDIESDAFFSLSVGTDADNPTGRQVLLDAIEDLDGDGLPEMVVYSLTGEGLFGKETRYEIHRGMLDASNRLTFEAEASSVVGSGGIQIDVERRDLNGDGTLEMMVTSFDLGLGSIVRALLSRTASLQLAIYEMEEGRYPDTPALTRKVTAKLDIGKGEIFVPAVLAADINGDGLKDLLVQDGDSKLKVFAGENRQNLFTRSPVTFNVELPEGDGYVQVANLDGDASDELLVVFAADKAEERAPRIHAVRFSQDK